MRPATLPPVLDRYVRPGKVRFVEAVATTPAMRRTTTDGSGGSEVPSTPAPVNPAQNLHDEERDIQQSLSNRQPLRFQPFTARRIILDLQNYYCAYPTVVTTGGRGAAIRLQWAESLFETPNHADMRKGNRNDVEGKYFIGVGATFHPDGGDAREFDTLWWEAGRYLELHVETADQPLELNLILRETRYPLEMEAAFDSSDDRLAAATPILLRGLQACAHETYVDCPYYEQLMYVGDTRLEALATYVTAGDDRLARKAISLFDGSRLSGGVAGLTQSRYPCRVRQTIPPFSLWWVATVHDFAMWRGDAAFVKSCLNGVRSVIDAYTTFRNSDGLVQGPALGWNFVDWVPHWKNGVPADADFGVSSIINFHFVYTLSLAEKLERDFGDPELATRCGRIAHEVAAATVEQFWEPSRGLFADDLAKRHFSEHAQCMAVLAGTLDEDALQQVGTGLLTQPDLSRATIYYTHYLFEACRELSRRGARVPADPIAHLFNRLSLWFDLKKNGFVTTFESPEPTRSDCHGWGAHPLFHYFATLLGVRPATWGMTQIEITPNLGPLQWAGGKLPHPAGGQIELSLRRTGDDLTGTVTLPENITGVLRPADREIELRPGTQQI
jgi:hypothetical protein